MSAGVTLATAARVLRQLCHDRRTVAMLLVVPTVLLGLLAWMLPARAFDQWGPPLLGIFPLIVMFLVTSVTTLRERAGGTLERLLSMPMNKADFVLGYGIAFGVAAVVQSLVVSAFAFWFYGMDVRGSVAGIVGMAVLDAVLGTALGLLVSAFARNEFQAVQFMPAVILPQLILGGLVVPRGQMPRALEIFSDALPLSYAVEAVNRIARATRLQRPRARLRARRRGVRPGLPGPGRGDAAAPHPLTRPAAGIA